MIKDIKTIILGGFNGNCYLLKTDKGFILFEYPAACCGWDGATAERR